MSNNNKKKSMDSKNTSPALKPAFGNLGQIINLNAPGGMLVQGTKQRKSSNEKIDI